MEKQLLVCPLAELINDQPRCFRIENIDLLVVRHGDSVRAVQNRCGHAGAALHLGDYTDGLIVCPLHGAAFQVESGAVEWTAIIPPPMAEYIHSENARIRKFGELLQAIETLPLKTYPVTVKDEAVYVSFAQ